MNLNSVNIKIYYISMIIINNIKINCLLLGYIFFPDKIKIKLIKCKTLGDEYYKYLSLITISDEISAKYKIDIFNIGLQIYNKYQMIINSNNNNNNNNEDTMSEIDELSDIED
mgnify:CR=1 FL=1